MKNIAWNGLLLAMVVGPLYGGCSVVEVGENEPKIVPLNCTTPASDALTQQELLSSIACVMCETLFTCCDASLRIRWSVPFANRDDCVANIANTELFWGDSSTWNEKLDYHDGAWDPQAAARCWEDLALSGQACPNSSDFWDVLTGFREPQPVGACASVVVPATGLPQAGDECQPDFTVCPAQHECVYPDEGEFIGRCMPQVGLGEDCYDEGLGLERPCWDASKSLLCHPDTGYCQMWPQLGDQCAFDDFLVGCGLSAFCNEDTGLCQEKAATGPCNENWQCLWECDSGQCVAPPQLSDGQACTGDDVCASDYCAPQEASGWICMPAANSYCGG